MVDEYFKVVDALNQEIKIGMECIYGSPPADGEVDGEGNTTEDYIVVVESISDPDADYDDELGRAVQYAPRVKVRFNDGETDEVVTHDSTVYTWNDYPDGPDCQIFMADDLEVYNG